MGDEKDHPIAVAAVLEEQLTEGKDEIAVAAVLEEQLTEEVNEVSDKDENSEDDLDKLLDEELDDLNIGEPSKLDTVTGITTEDLEAELEMDLDNLKLDDIDTTDVNLDDEELLED